MNKIKQAAAWTLEEVPITRGFILYAITLVIRGWFPDNDVVQAIGFYVSITLLALIIYGLYNEDRGRRNLPKHFHWITGGAMVLGAVCAYIVFELTS